MQCHMFRFLFSDRRQKILKGGISNAIIHHPFITKHTQYLSHVPNAGTQLGRNYASKGSGRKTTLIFSTLRHGRHSILNDGARVKRHSCCVRHVGFPLSSKAQAVLQSHTMLVRHNTLLERYDEGGNQIESQPLSYRNICEHYRHQCHTSVILLLFKVHHQTSDGRHFQEMAI
ncbi:unnamed protein product, partial [Pylaiella littoralis]